MFGPEAFLATEGKFNWDRPPSGYIRVMVHISWNKALNILVFPDQNLKCCGPKMLTLKI